jgi:hypothetical protein
VNGAIARGRYDLAYVEADTSLQSLAERRIA